MLYNDLLCNVNNMFDIHFRALFSSNAYKNIFFMMDVIFLLYRTETNKMIYGQSNLLIYKSFDKKVNVLFSVRIESR